MAKRRNRPNRQQRAQRNAMAAEAHIQQVLEDLAPKEIPPPPSPPDHCHKGPFWDGKKWFFIVKAWDQYQAGLITLEQYMMLR